MKKQIKQFRVAFSNFLDICRFLYYLELSTFGGSWWLLYKGLDEDFCKGLDDAYEKAFNQ